MRPKYSIEQFEKAKVDEKFACECYNCRTTFQVKKKMILLAIRKFIGNNGKDYSNSARFCSRKCQYASLIKSEEVNCKQCGKAFIKTKAQLKKTKNNFCSHSCNALFGNANKEFGTRRSKLEAYIEEQLISLYPSLKIDFNKKSTINSELDIYIPSLKLAFELNGIFHYEPIFGPEKLSQIQNNDQRKFQACLEKNIELVLIDSSLMKNFKKHKADNYLNIIIEIISKKI